MENINTDLFFFDKEKLKKIAEENKDKYQNADPCPHIYFDNFLPEGVVEKILAEFPKPKDIEWRKYEGMEEMKLACEDETKMNPHIRHIMSQFNSSTFLKFLEELTGIEGLVADTHYRGGGMHQTQKGGYLKIHVDFNWYPKLKLYRRLNILFFLNKDWKEEYGGHFELWDKDMKEQKVKVAPVFNRLAMFSTSEDSHHGHPDPLKTPEGVTRKSLALYYYTSEVGGGISADEHHTTIFKERPNENRAPVQVVKSVLRSITPPIVWDYLHRIKKNYRR